MLDAILSALVVCMEIQHITFYSNLSSIPENQEHMKVTTSLKKNLNLKKKRKKKNLKQQLFSLVFLK